MKVIKHFHTPRDLAENKSRGEKCTCKVEKRKNRSLVSKVANLFSVIKKTVGTGKMIFSAAAHFITKKNPNEEEHDENNYGILSSCEEYQPIAEAMCLTCQKHYPHMAPFSSYNCQALRPSMKICFRYHFQHPKVTLCLCSECNEKNLMFIQTLIEHFLYHSKNLSLKTTNQSKPVKNLRRGNY
uniref:Uncharacterized protein n=1 Tax=Clastoptera arizonana TaxID=38151 RepID=A0A1B6D6T9_9HEMI